LAASYSYETKDDDDNDDVSVDTMDVDTSFNAMNVRDDEDDTESYFSVPPPPPSQSEVSSSAESTYRSSQAVAPMNLDDRTDVTSSFSLRQTIAGAIPQQQQSRLREARLRCRQRRHDILSSLLLSCADYLSVEKGQAKAFVPMLTVLLSPPTKQERLARFRQAQVATWRKSAKPAAPGEKSTGVALEDQLQLYIDQIDHLGAFMDSLQPGSGIRCLALLLLQHLIQNKSGYDARVRASLKSLGVLILMREMLRDPVDVVMTAIPSDSGGDFKPCLPTASSARATVSFDDLIMLATRKFEWLEHGIAARLLKLSREEQLRLGKHGPATKSTNNAAPSPAPDAAKSGTTSRQRLMRGLKIGGTAVVAGTLFAVTGGLAAPGIAYGLSTIAGVTSVTAAAAAVLTNAAVVTTIFGVGGGTLAAYKMQRRTQGLTEFEFQKEDPRNQKSMMERQPRNENEETSSDQVEAELFSTVCISGWLRDSCDFQRPWGTSPTNPPLFDPRELLERFYSVYRAEYVANVETILERWHDELPQLWQVLREKYGRDPNHILPFTKGPRFNGALTLEQDELIDRLFVELGIKSSSPQEKSGSVSQQHSGHTADWTSRFLSNRSDGLRGETDPVHSLGSDSNSRNHPLGSLADVELHPSFPDVGHSFSETDVISFTYDSNSAESETRALDHLSTVWDYKATYGGEFYTLKWESDLLLELCDSVSDLAMDLLAKGTTQVLKHTAFASLLYAVAWPAALVNAANMIDGTWTLAVERSDAAGKELARSLLFSRAGNRPVTLVGYSFGARVIYSCLKELASYQEKWKAYQESKASGFEKKFRVSYRKDSEENGPFFESMREPASIVEDAIIMGMPNHLSLVSWRACRNVVAGRLVNCYSQKDLILSLMFQYKRLGLKPVCGTCPVNVAGVENFDVSDLVTGHQQYCLVQNELLKRVRHGQPYRDEEPK
jgi:Protein of unknown function (DUF726)